VRPLQWLDAVVTSANFFSIGSLLADDRGGSCGLLFGYATLDTWLRPPLDLLTGDLGLCLGQLRARPLDAEAAAAACGAWIDETELTICSSQPPECAESLAIAAADAGAVQYWLGSMLLRGEWSERATAEGLREASAAIDGGVLDSMGVVPLLRRGDRSVVALKTAPVSAGSWLGRFLMGSALFGVEQVTSDAYGISRHCLRYAERVGLPNVQLFDAELWPTVQEAVSGDGIAVLHNVSVRSNDYFGVEGYVLDTLVYIDPLAGPTDDFEAYLQNWDELWSGMSSSCRNHWPHVGDEILNLLGVPELAGNVLCLLSKHNMARHASRVREALGWAPSPPSQPPTHPQPPPPNPPPTSQPLPPQQQPTTQPTPPAQPESPQGPPQAPRPPESPVV